VRSAKAQVETVNGVPGVRFTTDTPEERELQDVQSELSGGTDLLPGDTVLPHLAPVSVAEVGRPGHSVISLWFPSEKRSAAEALLTNAGFAVS
jgi:hypothetical protein